MSNEAYAVGIVGVRINRARKIFFSDQKIRNCSCELMHIPSDLLKTFKICPSCGQELWDQKALPIEGYNIDTGLFDGFQILWDADANAYIGFGQIETGMIDTGPLCCVLQLNEERMHRLSEDRNKLKLSLEKLGVWDENQFGFWVIIKQTIGSILPTLTKKT